MAKKHTDVTVGLPTIKRMGQFILFFIGGDIPEDKWEQSVIDRMQWMQALRDQGKFVEGSPLSPVGKVLTSRRNVREFMHDQDSINGFALVKAEDMQEAVRIAKKAPQASSEYGSVHIEIRQLQPLV